MAEPFRHHPRVQLRSAGDVPVALHHQSDAGPSEPAATGDTTVEVTR